MKNIKALTLAFLLSVFGSSYALAEYGVTVGVTGSMAMIDASGTEIEGNVEERSMQMYLTTLVLVLYL